MSTEVTTSEQTSPEPAKPTGISDPNISFSDYERVRRGESLTAAASDTSAPSAPGVKAPEQKESTESEAVENEDEEGKDDAEAPDSEESEAKESDEAKPAKKKGGFQRRIDKLNAAKTAAQQEVEYWKQLALKQGAASDPKTAQPKADAPAAVTADAKPNPDNFSTHAEYVEAIADWKADQKLKERDQKEAQSRLQTEQQNTMKAHFERVQSFAQKTDDFEEMMENLEDVPRSAALEQIITSSENGPELLYELAKNPEEAKRIAKLTPLALAREIGKLESKLTSSAPSSSSEKKEPKKLTQAPKPIGPVGGGKAAGGLKTPEEMSFSEYEKYRREQMRRKRG